MRSLIEKSLILAACLSGTASTSSAEDPFSNGLPISYMGLMTPTDGSTSLRPVQPVPPAAGQTPAIQSGHYYTVELLESEGSGWDLDQNVANSWANLRRHQGYEVYQTEAYLISNGRTQVFHYVYWFKWHTRTQTEDTAIALRQAGDLRIHSPYVRVLHHQLMPEWRDWYLKTHEPHWESRVTGW